ncbi:branched-chain-amino-acid transaminase [Falsiroseomonas sp. HW251]|uniref:branched-chain-amino-acid transaminase n=1 Tax=Falsiroseomonas sp. HW251 TaxID=3390998 RepID=UPI003D3192BC
MAGPPKLMSLNGRLVAFDDARIHMLTPAFKYGACAFEGLRGYRDAARDEMHVFRLAEHLERLHFSMHVMRFDDHPGDAEMIGALRELVQGNDIRGDCHIRLMVWVDGDGEQTATGPIGWGIAAIPREADPRVREGIHVAVSSWTRIADNAMPPRIKVTANYNNGRLSGLQAKADGYGGVILLTASGHVSETPGACVFLVREGRLLTPAHADDILESITRATVLDLARQELGIEAEERSIARTELYAAQEAFLCGSGNEIQPILSVDRLKLGDGTVGPVTRRVQQAYFDAVRGGLPGRRSWLTPMWNTETAR